MPGKSRSRVRIDAKHGQAEARTVAKNGPRLEAIIFIPTESFFRKIGS